MATSGTYAFELANADILIEGFARCGIRRAAITNDQMIDGTRAINLAMTKLGILIPNLWAEEQYTQVLTPSDATYTLPSRAIMILSCFIRTGSGSSQVDRILSPVSQYEYASFSTKNAEGFPSVYWFNRLATPEITFYLTPDDTQTYTAYMQIARQLQDAAVTNGQTPDVPNRFLDALCAEVAYRVARIYARDLEMIRKQDAAEAWAIAATNDVENVQLNITPGLAGYYT